MFHRLLALLLALCLAPLALAADARGPTGALQGVRIQSLAVDPAEPDTLYAGSIGGGLFRSGNGGTSWAAFSSGLGNMDVRVVALDPATPGRLYAGTNTGGVSRSIVSSPTMALPDSGQPVTLALPGGGSITATAQQPGTQVQLVETVSGPMVAVVTAGSALLQHSTAGQPLTGMPRSGGMARGRTLSLLQGGGCWPGTQGSTCTSSPSCPANWWAAQCPWSRRSFPWVGGYR